MLIIELNILIYILLRLSCNTGEKMTEEQVDQLMAGQEDVDGNVNYTKFCEIMMDG